MSRTMKAKADPIKAGGVHYTPPALASFLAAGIVRHASLPAGPIRVLDPACGDGALLAAFVSKLPKRRRRDVSLVGYELDPVAAEAAESTLRELGARDVSIHVADFLDTFAASVPELFGETEPG